MQGGYTVRDHSHRVELENLWDVIAVVRDLVQRVLDGRIRMPWVFQLEESQWKPVHINHEIWTTVVLTVNGELVDYEEVILVGIDPVDSVDVPEFLRAVRLFDWNFI